MHVLVITNDLPPRVGGIQYYVDQLARGLVEAGDRVTMFGSTSDGWQEFDAAAPYTVLREPTSTLLPTPQVLLLSSGELNSFELTLKRAGSDASAVLRTSEDGSDVEIGASGERA